MMKQPHVIAAAVDRVLCLLERGEQRLTLEQVNGIGITSYILTSIAERTVSHKEYVRRTLHRGLLRKTVLLVPLVRTTVEHEVLACEVFTSISAAYVAFERAARHMC